MIPVTACTIHISTFFIEGRIGTILQNYYKNVPVFRADRYLLLIDDHRLQQKSLHL